MSASLRRWAWITPLVVGAALGAAPACLDPRAGAAPPAENPCTRCHGSSDNAGDALSQSAPPFDLKGNEDEGYPGVGAHRAHLVASPTHAPIPCSECHEVPAENDDPGHYDSERPAEIVFGELAASAVGRPHYDAVSRRCSNTHCHGDLSPIWTKPRSSADACGSCHGLPPAWPHPQSDDCARCHGEVVDARGEFTRPGLHVDGVVQLEEPSCSACHGSEENAAPPASLSGETNPNQSSVGAHQAHLSGGRTARALECRECHRVPEQVAEPGHLDGRGVEVSFGGVGEGTVFDAQTGTCGDGWCHGGAGSRSPRWNDTEDLGCGSCHGMPPPAPHPDVDNCSLCHARVVDASNQVVARELHVDGEVQAEQPSECTGCHGDPGGDDPLGAPPVDTLGNEATSARGVGAHQAHLVGRGLSRVLACEECHRVPETVDQAGHLGALPAEVELAGVARAFGAEPSYTGGTCVQTFCHGDSFIGGRPSGGLHTVPTWTEVGGNQITCRSCHGMPPPAPHPQDASNCEECHKNADGAEGFSRPDLHVDGNVTFFLSREDAERALAQD